MPGVYREEVLGRHCSILFQFTDKTTRLCPGQVTRYTAHLDDDGDIIRKHWVVFEDGDEMDLDLGFLSKEGRLKWLNRVARPPSRRIRTSS